MDDLVVRHLGTGERKALFAGMLDDLFAAVYLALLPVAGRYLEALKGAGSPVAAQCAHGAGKFSGSPKN